MDYYVLTIYRKIIETTIDSVGCTLHNNEYWRINREAATKIADGFWIYPNL